MQVPEYRLLTVLTHRDMLRGPDEVIGQAGTATLPGNVAIAQ